MNEDVALKGFFCYLTAPKYSKNFNLLSPMPTYEYECSKCDHHFEVFQSMSSAAYRTCPQESCPRKPWGKGKVKRLLGAGAGFLFKGSGFYITDYRSEGYKSSAQNESSSTQGEKGSSTDSSEKKTTATPETKAAPVGKNLPEKKNPSPKAEKPKKE